MRFQIRVPRAVKRKIASWTLSDACRKTLYRCIQAELRDRQDGSFPRYSVAPIRCAILPISFLDPETGVEREFVVYVNTTQELGVRIVLDCVERASLSSRPPQ